MCKKPPTKHQIYTGFELESDVIWSDYQVRHWFKGLPSVRTIILLKDKRTNNSLCAKRLCQAASGDRSGTYIIDKEKPKQRQKIFLAGLS